MNKIVIIGSPGAGKTTFAQKLRRSLPSEIEIFHLDRYFWRPGWKEYPRQYRIEKQKELTEKEHWIIEGTYLGSSDNRLNMADTIIFLDIPNYLCLWQVIKRRWLEAKKARPDLPVGCQEQLSVLYILKVLGFPYKGRRELLKKIREIRLTEQKTILTFRSSQAARKFLQQLSIEQEEERMYKDEENSQKSQEVALTFFRTLVQV